MLCDTRCLHVVVRTCFILFDVCTKTLESQLINTYTSLHGYLKVTGGMHDVHMYIVNTVCGNIYIYT